MEQKSDGKHALAGKKFQVLNPDNNDVVMAEGTVDDDGQIRAMMPDARHWRLLIDGKEYKRNY